MIIVCLFGTVLFAALGFLLARQDGRDAIPAIIGLFIISAGLWVLALRDALKGRS